MGLYFSSGHCHVKCGCKWLCTLHLSEPLLAGSQPRVDAPNIKILKIHNAVGRLRNICFFDRLAWPNTTVWTQHPAVKYQRVIFMETHYPSAVLLHDLFRPLSGVPRLRCGSCPLGTFATGSSKSHVYTYTIRINHAYIYIIYIIYTYKDHTSMSINTSKDVKSYH